MKYNVFKRTLAGVMAVLCVAAYMPANVSTGGILTKTAITASARDGNVVYSGDCGAGENSSGVKWTFYEDGTLEFTGTGDMANYDEDFPEWWNCLDSIKAIVICEGVTSIGNDAFLSCVNVTSVTIPKSVTSIGDGAFYQCVSLTSVTIPKSVTNIGSLAFCYCNSLTSITIPESVTSIGEGAFYGCNELSDIYCYANPDELIWYKIDDNDANNACFKPNKGTKIHVKKDWLDKYTTEFGKTVNATFVGDLSVPEFSSASVTLTDGFGLNFYVDGVDSTTAADYKVKFSGKCDEDGTEVQLNEKDGKFFATANINAKDIKEKITATLYKNGTATDTTLTYSVDNYLNNAINDSEYGETLFMLKATQLYGYAADEYFNNEDNGISQGISDYMNMSGITEDSLKETLSKKVENDNLPEDNKVSMVLNSKVKLRVYNPDLSDYREVTGLTPLTMGQNQEIEQFSVSGYTWVYRVLNNTASSQKNVNMAKALFAYMQAAENLNESGASANGTNSAPDPYGEEKKVTINGVEYDYKDGMTWKDIAEKNGWTAEGTICNDANQYLAHDGSPVWSEDLIDNSLTYEWNSLD